MTYTVLITGATGFLGSKLKTYLKQKGWNIITAGRNNEDIYMDLSNPLTIDKIRIKQKIDVCIHTAALTEVGSTNNPYESISTNVAGTRAVLDFCVANDIEKFIYISTMHVFGDLEGVLAESKIVQSSNDYGITHLFAEQYVELYRNKYGLSTSILRLSNLFDVPENIDTFNRWSLTPYAFCKQAYFEKKIIINTNGTQIRNFVSIKDVTEVICRVINQLEKYPLLHIFGPDNLTIYDLALKVRNVAVKDSDITIYKNEIDVTEYREFCFTSDYLKDLYLPSIKIEGFLRELTLILQKKYS